LDVAPLDGRGHLRGMMEFRPSLKRKTAGWGLMGLGVIGLVLPFLQGFLFLALGLFVLRHQYLWAHRGTGWIASRWPGTVARAEAMEQRLMVRTREATQRLRFRLRRVLGRS
jgi:Putative transmembrane protein (PGPGW)